MYRILTSSFPNKRTIIHQPRQSKYWTISSARNDFFLVSLQKNFTILFSSNIIDRFAFKNSQSNFSWKRYWWWNTVVQLRRRVQAPVNCRRSEIWIMSGVHALQSYWTLSVGKATGRSQRPMIDWPIRCRLLATYLRFLQMKLCWRQVVSKYLLLIPTKVLK